MSVRGPPIVAATGGSRRERLGLGAKVHLEASLREAQGPFVGGEIAQSNRGGEASAEQAAYERSGGVQRAPPPNTGFALGVHDARRQQPAACEAAGAERGEGLLLGLLAQVLRREHGLGGSTRRDHGLGRGLRGLQPSLRVARRRRTLRRVVSPAQLRELEQELLDLQLGLRGRRERRRGLGQQKRASAREASRWAADHKEREREERWQQQQCHPRREESLSSHCSE